MMSFVEILDNFHFLRPYWLLAFIPLLAVTLFIKRKLKAQSGWQSVLANHLYQHLISDKNIGRNLPPMNLLLVAWLLTCLALAGPTWERLPQPVYQVNQGKVIVMDMSLSMRSTDIAPNRLSRAKFKAIDLLNKVSEGEVGLVAYAGDAFVISPLTADVQNLTALIPSLSPEIMPTSGSEPIYAMEEAFALLNNAGYKKGDIYLITDGIELSEVAPLRKMLSATDFNLRVMGVGTEQGSPIKLSSGEFLKDNNGAVVIPKLPVANLTALAQGSGRYITIQADDKDIEFLSEPTLLYEQAEETQEEDSFGDQWKEMGPYLLLLLLPIAAYSFRRGVLTVGLLILLPLYQQPAHANWWQDMWQRKDQQGMQAFNKEDFATAAERFEDPLWRGSSHYRNGNFEQAASEFAQFDTSESNYNLGNALAKQQEFASAIAAYERALELDPNNEDAAANKKLLEDLMQQNDQQNQGDSESEDENESQENQDQESQQNDSQDSQSQDGEQGEQSDPQQQNQDSESQDSQSESEQSDSQQQESESQQQGEEQQENAEQQQQDTQQEESEGAEKEAEAAAPQEAELTEEQKEQMQKMERLLRKINADPAYLLQRKMQLEQQKRRRQQVPSNNKKDW
ncbi:MAG: VWA domain-containing protein [Alteromonadaceae bacterium]|nr:VWA domain-containing protein [Alteromonadaceae bacterium]